MYVQPVFTLVNVLHSKITTSENIPPQRREVIASGDWDCFFTLCCSLEGWNKRWNQEEIPRSSVCVFWFFLEKSKGFWVATFLLELFGGSCQQKQDNGNSSRNCGHKFSCASLLKRPICTYSSSQKKGFSFRRLSMLVSSFSFVTIKKWCKRLITSLYHDNISCSSTLFQSSAASFVLPSQEKS